MLCGNQGTVQATVSQDVLRLIERAAKQALSSSQAAHKTKPMTGSRKPLSFGSLTPDLSKLVV